MIQGIKMYIIMISVGFRAQSSAPGLPPTEDEGVNKGIRRGLLCVVLAMCLTLAACLTLAGCQAKRGDEVVVLLDDRVWDGAAVSPEAEGPRVYITLDGAELIDLPFSEPRTVTVRQPDGAENAVAITGDAVCMAHANCENQDCVNMGQVTLDNLELRVMGGFIVCLPHRISVEVRD